MLLVCVFLALCAGLTLGQQDVDDFVDVYYGYEFIYHDEFDLILAMYKDRCYFIRFPDSRESELEEPGGSTYYHHSPLQITEDSLLHHVWFNQSGNVFPSSLDAVRSKYMDILADFHCMDKHIYEITLGNSTAHPTATWQPNTTNNNNNNNNSNNNNNQHNYEGPHQHHSFCHGLKDGMHPYPGDCQRFLVCSNGQTFVEHCAVGTVFQQSAPGCNFPQMVPECRGH